MDKAQQHCFPYKSTVWGACRLPLKPGTHLLKASPDDGDPVLDGGDAVRVADGQNGLSHCYRCANIRSLFFHFLHELLNKKDLKTKMKKSTLAALLAYTVQEERFQCSFSLCGCSHRPLKPASWCLWYFLPSSKRWEEVKGLYKNDCLYYR